MKKVNPFKFGDSVMIPGASSGRLVTEIIGHNKIRVLNIVEITPAQRADWLRTPVKGEFVFIPGLVVSVDGVSLFNV